MKQEVENIYWEGMNLTIEISLRTKIVAVVTKHPQGLLMPPKIELEKGHRLLHSLKDLQGIIRKN